MWSALSLSAVYIALLGGYGYWMWLRVAEGAALWPLVLALPLVVVAIPLTVTLVSFALAARFRAVRPLGTGLTAAARARLFIGEFLAIAGNTPRMIGYRALVPDPPAAPSDCPVLLVHGVLCNAGVWHRFVGYCARHGVRPVYAVNYGPPLGSIDDFAEQLREKVDQVLAATGASQLVLVGHSMGGLVARAYVCRHGGGKVRGVITLGTPYEGSVHAWLAPGVSLSQLRPRNAWLAALGAKGRDDMPPVVSVWSWDDSMVAPQTSSRIAFGENIELHGVGHNALLRDQAVFQRVVDEIRRFQRGGGARVASCNAIAAAAR